MTTEKTAQTIAGLQSTVHPGNSEFALLDAALSGDIEKAKFALLSGAAVDAKQVTTGLTALHIAAARSNVPLAKLLIEKNAQFSPDAFGRWPSLVAAECGASDEMCDFIADAEATFLSRSKN